MSPTERDTEALVDVAEPPSSEEAVPDDGDPCPSCDTRGAWTMSRRHRFSPFGTVLAEVLAFWTAVFALLLDLTLWPAAFLALVGVALALARQTVRICGACGYVHPDD